MKEKERFDLIQALTYLKEGKKVKWVGDDRFLKMADDGFVMIMSSNDILSNRFTLSNLHLKSDDFELYEEPKPILDTEEKAYLEGVLRPFKDKVEYVAKLEDPFGPFEAIKVAFNDKFCHLIFPEFKKNTMYKGMERYKYYTLKELGLFDRKIY